MGPKGSDKKRVGSFCFGTFLFVMGPKVVNRNDVVTSVFRTCRFEERHKAFFIFLDRFYN